MISRTLGAGFVQKRMPNKVAWLQRKIKENRHNLLYYFMFLRLTPLVPNWFLNASSGTVVAPTKTEKGTPTVPELAFRNQFGTIGVNLRNRK